MSFCKFLLFQCREATDGEMKMLHATEHVEKLSQTSKMSEEELKEISQQYDFIYFHPVSPPKLTLNGLVSPP